MATETPTAPSVTPAQISFLAIYCPSLGRSDESVEDQIVFYSSKSTREQRRRHSNGKQARQDDTQEKNERLRQVGLAQGMVDFAKWVLFPRQSNCPVIELIIAKELL